MTSTTTINPWTWNEAYGYSQGVLVEAPRRTFYASGQGSLDADGNLVHEGDVGAQAALTMDNVETLLTAAGMTLADVVRYDVYTTDLETYFMKGHGEVAGRFAQAGVVPASGIATQVSALAVPGMQVEVVVTASTG
jgi:enamine deaminase RidA (YjgF/YER057c/UK114 family)